MDKQEQYVQALLNKIADLEKQVEQQAARIAELERSLNKNSSNSSKPPSSDGLSKPPRTHSLREKGQNKSGGQHGHKGETLKPVPVPDKIKRHKLEQCPVCCTSLASIEPIRIVKRQVFDLPQPKLEVTEHQAEIKLCACCHKPVMATFPDGVNAPVQYGEVIQSWSIYLQHQQLIPEDRLQETFNDLWGVPLATATLNRFSEVVYDQLAEFDSQVLSAIAVAPVKHLDETGFRITSQTQWLHVASTSRLTYYHVSSKRKALLDNLTGTVVHDHWKPYYQLSGVSHALCNQHHLRELKALIELDQERWASKMQRFLRLSCRYRQADKDQPIPEDQLSRLLNLYDAIVTEGIVYHEQLPVFSSRKGSGRRARRTGHNLVMRLKNYRDDVLRFLTNPLVPFTNNQAERDLRMMKCKQKISGGFRSIQGAHIFIRIRGFIATARKQGGNVFESIQQVIRGRVPMPA